jgi:Putative auto-transporter adhesin, head GIN domain
MRHRWTALGVAGVLALSACSVVSGSGQVASETREVSGFTRIDLSGNGEVSIAQGEAESLTIEADDNVLPVLTSTVSDSTLRLGTKPRTSVRTSNPIRYRVTVPELTGIILSGSGAIDARGLTLQTLQVDISGSGTVSVSGTAVEQDIELSGSGRYEAAGLSSEKAAAEISGSGQVLVAVSRELSVDISGSGTLTYSGDPSVEQSVSGSGKVIKE